MALAWHDGKNEMEETLGRTNQGDPSGVKEETVSFPDRRRYKLKNTFVYYQQSS